jgi:hypothetical protein
MFAESSKVGIFLRQYTSHLIIVHIEEENWQLCVFIALSAFKALSAFMALLFYSWRFIFPA